MFKLACLAYNGGGAVESSVGRRKALSYALNNELITMKKFYPFESHERVTATFYQQVQRIKR